MNLKYRVKRAPFWITINKRCSVYRSSSDVWRCQYLEGNICSALDKKSMCDEYFMLEFNFHGLAEKLLYPVKYLYHLGVLLCSNGGFSCRLGDAVKFFNNKSGISKIIINWFKKKDIRTYNCAVYGVSTDDIDAYNLAVYGIRKFK